MAQVKELLVSGAARVRGKVYAEEFVGAISHATSASKDSAGQDIISYTRSVELKENDAHTLVVTDGEGTASELTIADTTYSLATGETLGLTKLYTGLGTATDGTMTQNAIKSAIDSEDTTLRGLISALNSFEVRIVDELPNIGEDHVLYFVPLDSSNTVPVVVGDGNGESGESEPGGEEPSGEEPGSGNEPSGDPDPVEGGESGGSESGEEDNSSDEVDQDTLYEEYLWITVTDPTTNEEVSYFEKIGMTTADLGNYYTKSDVDTMLDGKLGATATAVNSAKATNDSLEQPIASTYIKGITIDSVNKTLTVTKGDNTDLTPLDIPDTTYEIGDDTTPGITKLYGETGDNTDGSMTQSAITTAIQSVYHSPSFTGTPTAPTVADETDSSTKIATTAFVQSAILAALDNLVTTGVYQTSITDAQGDTLLTAENEELFINASTSGA